MRGRPLRPLVGGVTLGLMVLLFANPLAALPVGPAPLGSGAVPEAAMGADPWNAPVGPAETASADGGALAWIDAVPLDVLPDMARDQMVRDGPTRLPAPDMLPGYDDLGESDRRLAWKLWIDLSARGRMMGGGSPWASAAVAPAASQDAAGGDNQSSEGIGTPRGLRPLWGLDAHGYPSDGHPADDDGAFFLVTSRGVMRFPGPDTRPEWMVKPGGYIGKTETTDANGDGVRDIVLGKVAWFGMDEPSIVVIDGNDGKVLWSGLDQEETIRSWTLTDVDGDGKEDLIGVDARDRLVAYGLDGTEFYAVEAPGLPGTGAVTVPTVYLHLYYDTYGGSRFADVDGDGTSDFVIGSRYIFIHYLPFYFGSTSVPFLKAVSGRDATELWRTPLDPTASVWLAGSGDFNGDGSDDILVVTEGGVGIGSVATYEVRYTVRSGFDTSVLAEDRSRQGRVCVQTCEYIPLDDQAYWPLTFADLDRDGLEEVVVLHLSGDEGDEGDEDRSRTSWDLSGRGAGVPGGPMEERYRHTIAPKGEGDVAEFEYVMLRDTNGDGAESLVAIVFTATETPQGRIEDLAVHIFTVDASGVQGGRMPDLIGYWDVDATGQAYGWTVRDDRWRPLDAEGQASGQGFRLVTNSFPSVLIDQNKDKVPDLMLEKSVGFMWVDGRNGRLIEDVERPIDSYISGVYEEKGKHLFLERHWGDGTYTLRDLKTLDPVWSLAEEELDGGWLNGLVDVTGDGRLDVVIWKFTWSFSEGIGGGGFTSSNTLKVLDMTVQEVVFARENEDISVSFADVLRDRPGTEILIRDQSSDPITLDLYVVGEEGPRWSYGLGSGYYRSTDMGYVLVSNRQEGEVLEVLTGESGELVSSYPLPADGFTSQLDFMRIDADRFPEMVMTIAVEVAEDEYTQEMIVYDWAREKEISRFPLEVGLPRTFYFDDWVYVQPSFSYLTAIVGDWDADGLVDFAYREAERPLVRSTADGTYLAVAPGKGSVIRSPDLNGDGRQEIGVYSDTARLRFFAYDARVQTIPDDEQEVRTVTDVNGSEAEEGAADFFDDHEKKGLPAPTFVSVLAVAAALASLARRRRP